MLTFEIDFLVVYISIKLNYVSITLQKYTKRLKNKGKQEKRQKNKKRLTKGWIKCILYDKRLNTKKPPTKKIAGGLLC